MRKLIVMSALAVLMSAPAFAVPSFPLIGGSSASSGETTAGNSYESSGAFNTGKSVTTTQFSIGPSGLTDTTTTNSYDFGSGGSFGTGTSAYTGEGGYVSSGIYGF